MAISTWRGIREASHSEPVKLRTRTAGLRASMWWRGLLAGEADMCCPGQMSFESRTSTLFSTRRAKLMSISIQAPQNPRCDLDGDSPLCTIEQ